MCSLDEDLQGMNLSLQAETDLDGDEDGDRFEIVLGDIDLRGEVSLMEGEEKVSRRKEVSDMDGGRLMPLFLLCEVSIFNPLISSIDFELREIVGCGCRICRKCLSRRASEVVNGG